jgi:DNA repair protein RecO
MHHIHRTKAFVLKSFQTKEADSSVVLLTENLGVVRAVAQGARKMESKMRQSIQDFSVVNVALVSGRTGWRLVNAGFINNFYTDIKNKNLRESVCKVFNLINRLIAGEMEDKKIFDESLSFVDFAINNQENFLDDSEITSFEVIFSARILYYLGYLKTSENIEIYLNSHISIESIRNLNKNVGVSQKSLVVEINRAIRDSHL